ncbi:MAG TPA: hypothetical protein VIG34_01895 [Xanthobacteraceae bacterium]
MRLGCMRIALAAAAVLFWANSARADGAFAVDGSDTAAPGSCKIESWVSFAGNGDQMFITSPACVVNLFRPFEFGGTLARTRADGIWGTGLSLKAKTNLLSTEKSPVGVGIAGGVILDLVTQQHTGTFFYVPVTFVLSDMFRINVNGGWLYDHIERKDFATWGAGFEWIVLKNTTTVTLIAEVFGQSTKQPAIQAGIRFTPHEKVDFDLIYGRNLAGEDANWITAGINLRF